MRGLSKVLLALLAGVWCSASAAFAFEFGPPDPGGGTGQIINGAQVTEPDEWPATFIFRSSEGSCTATAVGPQVILTAAHCIENEQAGTVRIHDSPISVQCFHHPNWATGNSTTDFALCLTQSEMTGFPFEVVNTAIAFPRQNDSVVLLGFGCTENGGHDKSFGRLFKGTATVVRTPSGSSVDTVAQGGAAVCFGDSGGAAYFNLVPSGNRRALVAVNSRGDISRFSFLSTTATALFVNWATNWSQEHGVEVCGLSVAAHGCR
ncbi:MAG: S1 family peptidase [Mesorhizobium sp.]|nr:MAG: S1 family peptidase [Mesorhizobium sp.]